jgi:hypothetical protein
VQEKENAMNSYYEDTYNIKYAPNSKDEEYVKGIAIPKAREVVGKYQDKDLSDPVIRRQMMQEFNTSIDKNRLASIQNTYQGWSEYQKERAKLQQKNMLSPLEKDPIRGWDSSIHGTFNQLPQEWIDPNKALEERWVKPLHDSTLKSYQDSEGNRHVLSGVNRNTMNDLFNNSYSSIASSREGKEAVALFKHDNGIDQNDHTKDAKILELVMHNIATPYIRQNETVHMARVAKEDKNKNPIIQPIDPEFYTKSTSVAEGDLHSKAMKQVSDFESGKLAKPGTPEYNRLKDEVSLQKDYLNSAKSQAES